MLSCKKITMEQVVAITNSGQKLALHKGGLHFVIEKAVISFHNINEILVCLCTMLFYYGLA